MIEITEEWIKAAATGGCILGGGGGGELQQGIEFAQLAISFGDPSVCSLEDLPPDCLLATVSAVGAPAAENKYVLPSHYVRALETLQDNIEGQIEGIITNEMGGFATVNGTLQSAVLDLPLVTAAGNGRAHPTGPMGSMGLVKQDDYRAAEAAAGGKGSHYLETFAAGHINRTSKITRKAAEEAGGLVAVARNPVSAEYVRKNGAIGATQEALNLGRAFLRGDKPGEKVDNVVDYLNGQLIAEGKVTSYRLVSQGGFDTGQIEVGECTLDFWNEYMTLEREDERLATFPDLIMTFDSVSGDPLTSADIAENQEVTVISAPADQLTLGAGMFDQDLLAEIEEVLNKPIINP